MKTCPICGKEIKEKNKIYCSPWCRRQAAYARLKEKKRCWDCGKPIADQPTGSVRCAECQEKHDLIWRKVCPVCGKPYQAHRRDQLCCSVACRRKWDRLHPPVAKSKQHQASRPFSDITVFLIHEYTAFGESLEEIAKVLGRPQEDIAKALATPLNDAELERLRENVEIRSKRKIKRDLR